MARALRASDLPRLHNALAEHYELLNSTDASSTNYLFAANQIVEILLDFSERLELQSAVGSDEGGSHAFHRQCAYVKTLLNLPTFSRQIINQACETMLSELYLLLQSDGIPWSVMTSSKGERLEMDPLAVLEKRRDELKRELARYEAAIAALRGAAEPIENHQPSSEIIEDICQFLEGRGPTHQNEIIEHIGKLRKERNPDQSRSYSSVWQSLESHIRRNKRISCIDPADGHVVGLKPLVTRRGPRTDSPTEYYQENWFVLKDNLK